MKKHGTAYVVSAFGLIAAFIVYQVWFSDTRKVLRRLREIEIALSVPAQEPEYGRLARIATLRHSLAEDLRVRAGATAPEVVSRDAVLGVIGAWRPPSGGLEVHFLDVQIKMNDDKTSAEVVMTVEVDRPDTSGSHAGGTTQETSAAAATLVKRNGEWVVTKAESRENPVKP